MTNTDVEWFKQCCDSGLVKGNLLEIGAARIKGASNLCDFAKGYGVRTVTGADIEKYDGVDVVADFGVAVKDFEVGWTWGQYETVCIFNVLEHTFDPITVLANALSCVKTGGTLLVVTPSIWPIHNYPKDYIRLLPDWYVEFAKRYNVTINGNEYYWLSNFGIECVNVIDTSTFPSFLTRRAQSSRLRYWISRISHKLLNTYGRSHWGVNSAIGIVFVKN